MCSSMNAIRRFLSSCTLGEYSKSMRSLLSGSLQNFFDLLPAELGHQRRAAAGVARMLARRGPVDHALRDALQDRGDAKQVVRHVEIPVAARDALAPGTPAVRVDVALLGRNAKLLEVEPLDAAELACGDVPAHAVIRKIGERVADRRELPVEHRKDLRLARMEDQVVQAV